MVQKIAAIVLSGKSQHILHMVKTIVHQNSCNWLSHSCLSSSSHGILPDVKSTSNNWCEFCEYHCVHLQNLYCSSVEK